MQLLPRARLRGSFAQMCAAFWLAVCVFEEGVCRIFRWFAKALFEGGLTRTSSACMIEIAIILIGCIQRRVCG